MSLRALTVRQPFATALVRGPKRVENRSWRPRLPRGGFYVAVHAGQTTEWDALGVVRRGLWPGCPRDLTLGAIIGVVQVVDVVDAFDRPHDPWAVSGQWCWVVGRRWRLTEPVPMRGRQGLWPVGEETRRTLRARAVEVDR